MYRELGRASTAEQVQVLDSPPTPWYHRAARRGNGHRIRVRDKRKRVGMYCKIINIICPAKGILDRANLSELNL